MRPFYTDAASTSIDLVPTCLLPKAAGICVMNRQALYTCLVCIQYDYCCFVDFEVMIAILTIFHFYDSFVYRNLMLLTYNPCLKFNHLSLKFNTN